MNIIYENTYYSWSYCLPSLRAFLSVRFKKIGNVPYDRLKHWDLQCTVLYFYAKFLQYNCFLIDVRTLHNLFILLFSTSQVVQLMILDCKRAVSLLIQHRDTISPAEVIGRLLGASKNCDHRYFLHLYLHSLFEFDLNAGKEFHDLQVIFVY